MKGTTDQYVKSLISKASRWRRKAKSYEMIIRRTRVELQDNINVGRAFYILLEADFWRKDK